MFSPPVTFDEADRFLNWGILTEAIDGEEPPTLVQLRKVGNRYEVRVALREGISLEVAEPVMSQLACQLQEVVFGGSDVDWVTVELGDFDKIIRRSVCLD